MMLCIEAIAPKTELDTAVGFAVCQCNHESLPTDGDMTPAKFEAELAACSA